MTETMQSMHWIFFAAALCISTWFSTIASVHVNNVTAEPCNSILSDAPALQNITSPDGESGFPIKGVSEKYMNTNELPLKTLPPVHVNSSWIGNQWIPPPGYRLHSTREIQSYFQKRSILWVGDSTARRAYGTMYGILNATEAPDDVEIHQLDHPRVLNMNKTTVDDSSLP